MRGAVPDTQTTIEQLLADGDYVDTVRLSISAAIAQQRLFAGLL